MQYINFSASEYKILQIKDPGTYFTSVGIGNTTKQMDKDLEYSYYTYYFSIIPNYYSSAKIVYLEC